MIAGEGMIHYEAQQNAEDVKKGKKNRKRRRLGKKIVYQRQLRPE